MRNIVLLAAALVAATICSVQAQTYTMTEQVLSGGATDASNGSYSLSGTMHQSVIGLTGSNTQLQHGFWRYIRSLYPCCIGMRGNVNNDERDVCDLTDLSLLSNYLSGGGATLPCYDEANVDGLGIVNLSDLTYLTSYLTGGGTPPVSCP